MEAGKKGKAPRARLPITPAILHKLRAVWLQSQPSPKSIMLWAASTVTFFSFCRSKVGSSYDPNTHLSIGDLSTDNAQNPSVISLNIKHSKTDQGRRGVRVVIGRTDDDIYPIAALLSYLVTRGNKPGALFLWVPLYQNANLSRKYVRSALSKAGLPARDYVGKLEPIML